MMNDSVKSKDEYFAFCFIFHLIQNNKLIVQIHAATNSESGHMKRMKE